jgi:hypothetical protein
MNWKAVTFRIARVAMAAGLLGLGAFVLFVWSGRKDATLVAPATQAVVPIALSPMSEPKVEDPATGSTGGLRIGETRMIDFAADPADLGDNAEQREEQLRDWLLRVVVARAGLPGSRSARLSADLESALTDLAGGRSPGLGPGPIRWIENAPGEAFALIPKSDADSRRADMARVADELAWKNHQLPLRISAFEYQIDATVLKAQITRRAPIERAAIFSSEFGYSERLVVSKAGLRDFLATVDDVVAIRNADDARRLGVRIGGRRLHARRPRGLSPADALAAWDGFERANNEVWQFAKWAEEQVGAFNGWSRDQSQSLRESFERSNQDIKESWLLGTDVDGNVSELEKQASGEAANFENSRSSRRKSLLAALNERKQEMQETAKGAWSAIPESVRAGWDAIVMSR